MASSSLPLPSSSERLSLSFRSPPSPSLTPEMKDGEYSNWSELPTELTSSILQRLGPIEVLENAQKVCTSWRRVSKDPAMWRKIVMHKVEGLGCNLDIMCRHAVDRSQGGLVEIEIWDFGTDSLINYIADSSSGLRSLKLAKSFQVTDDGLTEAVVKLPYLEELEVSNTSILSAKSLKVLGQSCPNLKTFKLNQRGFLRPRIQSDDDALAIAETMHGLRHLQLFGNILSDVGLNAILDNCPNLEHLDLRQCFNVNLLGDLEKRCDERIKVFRRPNDSTYDYPYDATAIDIFSDEVVFRLMPDANYYPDLMAGSDYSDYDPTDDYDF
ncbi:F-box protein SKIP19 [Brassica rapa]|uniref:F-box domain-containing protein n=2 Tax=Brassica campestris TaxID=3711 RepID=M4C9D7_BRACM|nr:F-box protein SKIP19 [Brassica rapa]